MTERSTADGADSRDAALRFVEDFLAEQGREADAAALPGALRADILDAASAEVLDTSSAAAEPPGTAVERVLAAAGAQAADAELPAPLRNRILDAAAHSVRENRRPRGQLLELALRVGACAAAVGGILITAPQALLASDAPRGAPVGAELLAEVDWPSAASIDASATAAWDSGLTAVSSAGTMPLATAAVLLLVLGLVGWRRA